MYVCMLVPSRVCACECWDCQKPEELDAPGGEVIGSCELLSVGARNQKLILYKKAVHTFNHGAISLVPS